MPVALHLPVLPGAFARACAEVRLATLSAGDDLHPRHPAGAPEGRGGEFAPKNEAAARADRIRERNRKKAPLPQADQQEIVAAVVARLDDPTDNEGEDFGAVSPTAVQLADPLGVDLEGYTKRIDPGFMRHTIKEHGDPASEAARGQVAIRPDDFLQIPEVMDNPSSISQARDHDGEKRLQFAGPERSGYQLIVGVRVGKRRLVPVTFFKKESRPTAP